MSSARNETVKLLRSIEVKFSSISTVLTMVTPRRVRAPMCSWSCHDYCDGDPAINAPAVPREPRSAISILSRQGQGWGALKGVIPDERFAGYRQAAWPGSR